MRRFAVIAPLILQRTLELPEPTPPSLFPELAFPPQLLPVFFQTQVPAVVLYTVWRMARIPIL